MLYGLPFTQLEHFVKLEKLHYVPFIGWYENWIYGSKFHHQHSRVFFFFRKMPKRKLKWWILLPSCVTGQQNHWARGNLRHLCEPRNLPVMNFFEIAAPGNSQDAPGLKEAIILAFLGHCLDSALKKRVFLLSNGASVNSRSNFGLFQEDCAWLAFLWCFSHTLELSLKDAFLEFLKH